MSKMVATLLDISRFQQGKLIIERPPIDLCALVMRGESALSENPDSNKAAIRTPPA